MLRILRLLRVIRVTRSPRVIRFICELRVMVLSLTGSLKSLAWAIVLIMIILLVFGVCITDGVIAYCVSSQSMGAESTKEMRRYFGTVPAATLSLYMAMSGGDDWANLMRAIDPLPWEYKLLLLSFTSFAILALLNVVTAVFVNTAIQRSKNDREMAVQQEMENESELIAIIQEVFMELDTNHSGALSFEEFERHIDDDKIIAFLRSREIDVRQIRTLFHLLDTDQTGDVDMEEFVAGILRLKGGATTLDMAVLNYQLVSVQHQIEYVVSIMKPFSPAAQQPMV